MYIPKKLSLLSIFLFFFTGQIFIGQMLFSREAKGQLFILGEQFECVRSSRDYHWSLYSESIFLKDFYNQEVFCNSVASELNEYYPQGYEYLVICEKDVPGLFNDNQYFILMSVTGPTNNLVSCPSDDHIVGDRIVAELPDPNYAEVSFRNFFQPYDQSIDDYVETFMDFESSPNGKFPGMHIDVWLNAAREF